ncbi:hypothetical protein KAM621c_48220 [Citrobacter braakii]|uniref:Uncharacterized protein n=1 Tax=Citrobacter braakii TaxID=57706 RepID=A0AAD1L6S4_CITBR|nr:hypothetical protein KAM621c_48220 [Citrobacter braakii]
MLAQTVKIDLAVIIHWRNGRTPDASKLRLTSHVVDSLFEMMFQNQIALIACVPKFHVNRALILSDWGKINVV